MPRSRFLYQKTQIDQAPLIQTQLLVCAIRFTTATWVRPRAFTNPADILPPGPSPEHQATARAFFTEAKKRIGFLEHDLIAIQCYFIASLYEKSYLRPLQAWFYLQQAITILKGRLLWRKTLLPRAVQSSSERDLHLEQRVFWSCCRAER